MSGYCENSYSLSEGVGSQKGLRKPPLSYQPLFSLCPIDEIDELDEPHKGIRPQVFNALKKHPGPSY
jgi:hypothetical protein